jgi:hypothetical protein
MYEWLQMGYGMVARLTDHLYAHDYILQIPDTHSVLSLL